jgi:hypothetical protein
MKSRALQSLRFCQLRQSRPTKNSGLTLGEMAQNKKPPEGGFSIQI